MEKNRIQRVAKIIKQNKVIKEKQSKLQEKRKEKAKKIATILNNFKTCLELID